MAEEAINPGIEKAIRRGPKPQQEIPVIVPTTTEITVSVKATIPTLEYGNIEFFVSEKFIVTDDHESREHGLVAGMQQCKAAIAKVVFPLAEAEVERAKSVLLSQRNPDNWMQLNNKTYRWLRVAEPDMVVPAMEAIINDEGRIARIAAGNK